MPCHNTPEVAAARADLDRAASRLSSVLAEANASPHVVALGILHTACPGCGDHALALLRPEGANTKHAAAFLIAALGHLRGEDADVDAFLQDIVPAVARLETAARRDFLGEVT